MSSNRCVTFITKYTMVNGFVKTDELGALKMSSIVSDEFTSLPGLPGRLSFIKKGTNLFSYYFIQFFLLRGGIFIFSCVCNLMVNRFAKLQTI